MKMNGYPNTNIFQSCLAKGNIVGIVTPYLYPFAKISINLQKYVLEINDVFYVVLWQEVKKYLYQKIIIDLMNNYKNRKYEVRSHI